MIYGHHKNLSFFDQLIKSDELSHAYGFVGMSGIGKSTFAVEVTKKIADHICQEQAQKTLFFNRDFLHIQKEENKISVEKINQLEDFFAIKSNFGKKIAIIDDFDVITEQMQNKLLKLLEEPPQNALFFLIIENKYKVLPTILSRLTLMNFNPLNHEDMKKIIQDQNKSFDDSILELSYGSMNYYFKWFEPEFYEDVNRIFELYENTVSHANMNLEEFTNIMKKHGEYAIYILDLLIKKEQDSIFVHEKEKNQEKLKKSLLRMQAINQCKRGIYNSQNEALIYDTFLFDIMKETI